MRKIEQQMITAIREAANFSKDNTRVSVDEGVAEVRLHGNLIASYTYATQELVLLDADWQTVTTKSRLNALLSVLAPNYRIGQKNFKWFIRSQKNDIEYPFNKCAVLSGNALGAA